MDFFVLCLFRTAVLVGGFSENAPLLISFDRQQGLPFKTVLRFQAEQVDNRRGHIDGADQFVANDSLGKGGIIDEQRDVD